MNVNDIDAVVAEAAVVADLTRRGTAPVAVEAGALLAVVDASGDVRVIDTDAYALTPRRKRGTVILRDADSLIDVVKKHAEIGAEIYANVDALQIAALLNAGSDKPGWGDHRAILALRTTKAWTEWLGRNGKFVSQTEFAEFVEQRLVDVIEPDGADLLELAQTFKATKAVAFESSKRLSTGQVQLTYKEDIDAKAGTRGQIAIPETFILALIPFDGAKAYKVTARLRYRIDSASLLLGFVLERPEDVLETAFNDVATEVGQAVDLPVWTGTPA